MCSQVRERKEKVKFFFTARPSDYFAADITLNGKVVSKLYGSYMSYIEFDGRRYWDFRENFDISHKEVIPQLPSSSLFREDRIKLEQGNLVQAQEAKEKLENIQRYDRKLREAYKKKNIC